MQTRTWSWETLDHSFCLPSFHQQKSATRTRTMDNSSFWQTQMEGTFNSQHQQSFCLAWTQQMDGPQKSGDAITDNWSHPQCPIVNMPPSRTLPAWRTLHPPPHCLALFPETKKKFTFCNCNHMHVHCRICACSSQLLATLLFAFFLMVVAIMCKSSHQWLSLHMIFEPHQWIQRTLVLAILVISTSFLLQAMWSTFIVLNSFSKQCGFFILGVLVSFFVLNASHSNHVPLCLLSLCPSFSSLIGVFSIFFSFDIGHVFQFFASHLPCPSSTLRSFCTFLFFVFSLWLISGHPVHP